MEKLAASIQFEMIWYRIVSLPTIGLIASTLDKIAMVKKL